MLALLRATSRCPLYRRHVDRLTSREPDDIWHAEGRWHLAFALRGRGADEEMLLVVLDEPGISSPARVQAALRLMRDPAGLVSVTES